MNSLHAQSQGVPAQSASIFSSEASPFLLSAAWPSVGGRAGLFIKNSSKAPKSAARNSLYTENHQTPLAFGGFLSSKKGFPVLLRARQEPVSSGDASPQDPERLRLSRCPQKTAGQHSLSAARIQGRVQGVSPLERRRKGRHDCPRPNTLAWSNAALSWMRMRLLLSVRFLSGFRRGAANPARTSHGWSCSAAPSVVRRAGHQYRQNGMTSGRPHPRLSGNSIAESLDSPHRLRPFLLVPCDLLSLRTSHVLRPLPQGLF